MKPTTISETVKLRYVNIERSVKCSLHRVPEVNIATANINRVRWNSESVTISSDKTAYRKNIVFSSIFYIFYNIVKFLCITFDTYKCILILTDRSVTIAERTV